MQSVRMVNLSPLSVKSLTDQIYERIAESILAGDLKPGSRISESMLARTLGISRGPLREALHRLEGQHLVERTPNTGVRVVAPTAKEIVDCYAVREPLEGMACRLACENMTDHDLGELERLLDSHGRILDGVAPPPDNPRIGDLDFHFKIIRASGNAKLVSILCDQLCYLTHIVLVQSGVSITVSGKAYEEHRRVFDALRARDSDRAEQEMRAHIRNSIKTFETFLFPDAQQKTAAADAAP